MAGPAVISSVAREAPRGTARIPHLMTHSLFGTLEDAPMWEFMLRTRAEAWNEGPLPDQRFFEDHLPDLLKLRADARVGTPMAPQIDEHAATYPCVSYTSMLTCSGIF